jgi:molybdopterin-containing oxidoreductase family membrane subunit
MVLVLAIPIRYFYGVQDMITMRHLDNAAKIMLGTGLIVAYGYTMEAFYAYYSGNFYERFMFMNRVFGPMGWAYACLISFNILIPQLLWIRKVRQSPAILFVISLVVLFGMWLERFVIIVVSLSRDFLPSSWGSYVATRWDYAIFAGTLGLFFTAMFLFVRLMPMITIFEMRTLLPEAKLSEEVAAHD